MNIEGYDLNVPSLVRLGVGKISELGGIVSNYGSSAWLVTGTNSFDATGVAERVSDSLAGSGVTARKIASSKGEPTVDDVVRVMASLPPQYEDIVVVAIGGGATIDLAKAVAALVTNLKEDEIREDIDLGVINRLEGVGRNLSIKNAPLPVVAVPTTAGTGAEATRNAVISCSRRRFKKSMRSPMMVPRAALIDPLLCTSCPRMTTVATGMDAITQLIESFICRFAQPIPQSLVLDALPRAIHALPRILRDSHDLEARTDMSHAAFVSGVALANSGLGMAHGVAAALGVECGTPHGLACAVMLPVALRTNLKTAASQLAQLERCITLKPSKGEERDAEAFVDRIETLCHEVGVPRRLSDIGLPPDKVAWLAENSRGASMRGNPRTVTEVELQEILQQYL